MIAYINLNIPLSVGIKLLAIDSFEEIMELASNNTVFVASAIFVVVNSSALNNWFDGININVSDNKLSTVTKLLVLSKLTLKLKLLVTDIFELL